MLSFTLTSSPDECQSKSFEKMNTLLSAIFKNAQIQQQANWLASSLFGYPTAERLTRVPRVKEVVSSNPIGRPNLTQSCKRFATASTSTQVVVLPWR